MTPKQASTDFVIIQLSGLAMGEIMSFTTFLFHSCKSIAITPAASQHGSSQQAGQIGH